MEDILPLFNHEFFMRKALAEAQKAYDHDEVPIGAVITCNNQVIGKGYNQTETLGDVTAHAEMLAITSASNQLNSKYLEECTLYVTIEPCVMCAGAIKHARFGTIVVGAREPKTGFSNFLTGDFNEKTTIEFGVMETECREMMQSFFAAKRNKS